MVWWIKVLSVLVLLVIIFVLGVLFGPSDLADLGKVRLPPAELEPVPPETEAASRARGFDGGWSRKPNFRVKHCIFVASQHCFGVTSSEKNRHGVRTLYMEN